MTTLGPKEARLAELRTAGAVPKHVEDMLTEGLPLAKIAPPGEEQKPASPPAQKTSGAAKPGVPATATTKTEKIAAAKSAVAETKKPAAPAPAKQEESDLRTPTKKTTGAKSAAKKARTPVKKEATTSARPDGLREGSKQAKLLDAAVAAGKNGATEKDLCKKLGGWKKCAVTLRRVAEKVGARVERKDGKFVVTMPAKKSA